MYRIVHKSAHLMAILGGLVLTALILLTCLSVVGRSLNTLLHGAIGKMAPDLSQWLLDLGIGPILGDFELVEAGVAFAIFAFIPLCQVTAGHASVNILTHLFPTVVNRILQLITEIVFAVALVLIAWKLFDGMLSKRSYGETTFLLEFPIWWSYAASLFAAVVAAFAGLFMAVARFYEFISKRKIIPTGSEAEL